MSEDLFDFEELENFGQLIDNINNPTPTEITDFTKKEIGDRVVIIDYSSVTKKHRTSQRTDKIDEVNNIDYFIVVEINLDHRYVSEYITYIQDMVIVNPITKDSYRICSRHTKCLK